MTRTIKTLDLSPDGVDAILAAVTDAGLTVYYNETDGDTTIDIHLRPVDEGDTHTIVLTWSAGSARGWAMIERDTTGVETRRWPLGDLDIEDAAVQAARILERVEAGMAAAPAGTDMPDLGDVPALVANLGPTPQPDTSPATEVLAAAAAMVDAWAACASADLGRDADTDTDDPDTICWRAEDELREAVNRWRGENTAPTADTRSPEALEFRRRLIEAARTCAFPDDHEQAKAPKPAPTITDATHTTPASIATALEWAARDLRAMGDVSFAPTWVNLSLQVVQSEAAEAERIATVDTLSEALVGAAGEHGKSSYGVAYRHSDNRGDLTCQVYTNPGEVAQ